MKTSFLVFLVVMQVALLTNFCIGNEVNYSSFHSVEEVNELTSAGLFGCNPLKDLNSFAMHPLYSILSPTLKNKVMDEITVELEKIGKVVKLEVPDPIGYGKSQAYLSLSLINISIMDGQELPIIQASLNVDTSTIVKKTGIECMTHAWEVHTFFKGHVNDKNESQVLQSIKNILRSFIEDYKTANPEKRENLTFYLYI